MGMGARTQAARRGLDTDTERRAFLVEVARLHYEYGLNQESIAKRFSVSRSTISRALSEAQEVGIVQVTVTEPVARELQLSLALRERYGISVHVGMRLADDGPITAAARAAARLVERITAAGHLTLAASWGRTLAATARLMRSRRPSDLTVVDAIGHASGTELAPAIEVTRALAAALGTEAIHVPSPAFADSVDSLEFLLASQPVAHALGLARAADVTLVSVGVVGEESLLRREDLLSSEMMRDLIDRGARGEILGHYFDAAGDEIAPLSLLPVGLSLDDLRSARRVIAVAGGETKAASVRAAIAGDIIDELVADNELAESLLSEVRAEPLSSRPVRAGRLSRSN